ncbi:hypothetical protein V5R04_13310 [Jonesiaceae bacterium BS-20]|uniref:Uncharacterized protein n=1 Tax=Jonesiaceae bacterium BS-20 TaxID=3120821 RepID=A0AAU7DV98_9MICO
MAHALVEHSAYEESWTPASRKAFKVIVVLGLAVALSGLIGFFNHQVDLHYGGGAGYSVINPV